MKHYKHTKTNTVYGFESTDTIPKEHAEYLIEMTDSEFETFKNPAPTPEQKAAIAEANTKAHTTARDALIADARRVTEQYEMAIKADRKTHIDEATYKQVCGYICNLGDWQQGETEPAKPAALLPAAAKES